MFRSARGFRLRRREKNPCRVDWTLVAVGMTRGATTITSPSSAALSPTSIDGIFSSDVLGWLASSGGEEGGVTSEDDGGGEEEKSAKVGVNKTDDEEEDSPRRVERPYVLRTGGLNVSSKLENCKEAHLDVISSQQACSKHEQDGQERCV